MSFTEEELDSLLGRDTKERKAVEMHKEYTRRRNNFSASLGIMTGMWGYFTFKEMAINCLFSISLWGQVTFLPMLVTIFMFANALIWLFRKI